MATSTYEDLPFNHFVPIDILVRGGLVVTPRGPLRLDLALTWDDPVAKRHTRIREVGDLDDAVALDTLDMNGRYLFPDPPLGTGGVLSPGEAVTLVVRRVADRDAPVERRIGNR